MSDAAWVGVDPGVSGAVVALDSEARVIAWWDTPTLTVPGPKRHSRRKGTEGQLIATVRQAYDKSAMARMLWDLAGERSIMRVVIEAVQPMPRWGRHKGPGDAIGSDTGRGSNSFTDFGLGRSLGLWEGICAALELRVELVPAVTWKAKLVPRIATDPGVKPLVRRRLVKAAARARALDLFPEFAEHLSRAMDDGRAEAGLLALYGLRHCS